MEKYKRQDVSPIEKENERDENYQGSNPQIDSERTSGNNWTIVKEIDRKKRKERTVLKKSFLWGGYNYAREKKLCSNWLGVKRPSEECGRREL